MRPLLKICLRAAAGLLALAAIVAAYRWTEPLDKEIAEARQERARLMQSNARLQLEQQRLEAELVSVAVDQAQLLRESADGLSVYLVTNSNGIPIGAHPEKQAALGEGGP